MAKKAEKKPTPCAITRAEFNEGAPKGSKIMEKILEEIALGPKHFSSGGFGYYGNGKISVKIGDEVVRLQVGINVSVVNSKNAEDGTPSAEASDDAADSEAA